jgi:hypothetical protein
MKIAVTVTTVTQVGMDAYRDYSYTAIFDSSQSLDEMLRWARTYGDKMELGDLAISEVVSSVDPLNKE